jgi:integrase/recombinase XerD
MVLLSFKAGLRACEISGLKWTMVEGAGGAIAPLINIPADIAKMGSKRRIPMHSDLTTALKRLRKTNPKSDYIIRSERGGRFTAKSVVNWFAATYQEVGLEGCSSHSGRRTFVTQTARLVAKTGGSLRDVQELAGHRAITTTERYIEGDRDAQRKLISLL